MLSLLLFFRRLWLDDGKLCEICPALFNIIRNQDAIVALVLGMVAFMRSSVAILLVIFRIVMHGNQGGMFLNGICYDKMLDKKLLFI
jgi:hypothetical protein